MDSLLGALLVGLAFALDFPKKSFAVAGWDFGSSFTDLGGSAGLVFTATGAETGAGGGRRAARRLVFGFVMEPYCVAVSRGSSEVVRSWISRVTSERIWRF